MKEVKAPLTNLQMEILKLFPYNLTDETLIELRKVISKFLLENLRDEVDKVWEEKGYNEETIKKWLNED